MRCVRYFNPFHRSCADVCLVTVTSLSHVSSCIVSKMGFLSNLCQASVLWKMELQNVGLLRTHLGDVGDE